MISKKLTELREEILGIMNEKKPIMLSNIAKDFNHTEQEVAHALPDEMRSFAGADQFDAIWTELTTWAKATFIITKHGNVVEIRSPIPNGNHSHGYFNLTGDHPLSGHLKISDLNEICFLSLPFMGKESHSLQFFNNDGNVIFSIYVGRENRILIPEAKDSFFNLQKRYN